MRRPMRIGISQVLRSGALAIVCWRLVRGGRPAPPVGRADPDAADAEPVITVVVPARDEADRIGPLLDAISVAPGVAEVIVVDDESTDRTAAVAAERGARIITGTARPPGWAGKTWALEQGVAAAATAWIVTLDADTRPDPGLPLALIARLRSDDLDLLTVGGRFDCPTPGARWLHAAMLTTLVYRYGPPGGARPTPPHRMLANGQCMAFERSRLVEAGGFGLVASSVVEDMALARLLARRGGRVAFLDAAELLTVRMFEDLGSTWRGWGRSLGLPGVEPAWRRAGDAAILAVTMPIPLVRALVGRADAVDAAALMIRLGTLVGTRRAYRHPDRAYWLSPLADAPAVASLVGSLLRRTHTWRGRSYDVG